MTYLETYNNIGIRKLIEDDCNDFLQAAKSSKDIHEPFINLPDTETKFNDYLKKFDGQRNISIVIENVKTKDLLGIININEIVRGAFQNGFLGYYIFAPYQNQGFMTQGLKLVLEYAKEDLKLHRLESNIQPSNTHSIALVKKLGFVKEGYSKNYLKINGKWRDHERWAYLLF